MQPVLSVAETAPVMSALDLYYETSLCGKLEVLNSSISVGSVAPSGVTNPTGTFTEGVALNAEIGNIFKLTKERVRQIKEKALRKLRNNSYSLLEYLTD